MKEQFFYAWFAETNPIFPQNGFRITHFYMCETLEKAKKEAEYVAKKGFTSWYGTVAGEIKAK